MIAVVQRVSKASCSAEGRVTGSIGKGFVVFLGCGADDDEEVLRKMVQKITRLRVFRDGNDKMNLSLSDVGGSVLLISQFTLLADCKSGNRPSFSSAMKGEDAAKLYEKAIAMIRESGLDCQCGAFGKHMAIEQVNDGPVTIILDSSQIFH